MQMNSMIAVQGDSLKVSNMLCMAGAWKSLPGTGSNAVSGTSCPGEMPCGRGHSLSAARNNHHSVSMHSKQTQAPLQQSLPVVIADYHSAAVNAWHAGPSCSAQSVVLIWWWQAGGPGLHTCWASWVGVLQQLVSQTQAGWCPQLSGQAQGASESAAPQTQQPPRLHIHQA